MILCLYQQRDLSRRSLFSRVCVSLEHNKNTNSVIMCTTQNYNLVSVKLLNDLSGFNRETKCESLESLVNELLLMLLIVPFDILSTNHILWHG